MALPKIIGEATIWPASRDTKELELRFAASGTAVLNFNASFQQRKQNDSGDWETTGQVQVRVSAFGTLAEDFVDRRSATQSVPVTIRDVQNRPYEKQDGTTGYSLEGILETFGAPRAKRSGGNFNSPEPSPFG